MKEITRIHIAKVAYDIEIQAKKEIENYVAALESYANDPEIFDDIEIRITELLAEHRVVAGGVITSEAVSAIRAQLGEPSDFASDAEDETNESAQEGSEEGRRVYRDTSNGILGGVLSGIGRFFGIDPLWVRLLFIVLFLSSLGTALILYLIMWLIVPPAETAAEKLRMHGKAVTLESIKSLVGTEGERSEGARIVRRVIRVGVGSVLVLLAIAGLLAIIAVVFGAQFGFVSTEFAPVSEGWIFESGWFMAMTGLLVVSGLLFSALCFILASAVFSRHWTRRVGVAVVAIIALGLVLFAGGVGAGMYGYASEEARIVEMRQTTSEELPANFGQVQKLVFAKDDDSIYGHIQYHVSDKSYYELESLPGVMPQIVIADDGLTAKVKLIRTDSEWSAWDGEGKQTWRPWYSLDTPILNIYGPEVDSIESASRTASYYNFQNNTKQEILTVTVQDGSEFDLAGTFGVVRVLSEGLNTSASLEKAAIDELYVDGGNVTASVVRLLDVKQPDVCAGDMVMGDTPYRNYVRVRSVSGGKFIFNGTEQAAKTVGTDCGRVIIGDEIDE